MSKKHHGYLYDSRRLSCGNKPVYRRLQRWLKILAPIASIISAIVGLIRLLRGE